MQHVEPVVEGRIVGVVVVVVVERSAAQREDGEVDQGHDEHHDPRAVGKQVCEILPWR